MSKNAEVAALLTTIADLLEAHGENRFKVRAYRVAAQSIDTLDEDIAGVHRENRLRQVPGVGEHIAEKISQFLTTGKLDYLDKLKKGAPKDFEQLVQIEGLGPKRVLILYKKLGVQTLKDLEDAAVAGKIAKIGGFGEKSQANILEKLGQLYTRERTPYAKAKKQADTLLGQLRKQKEIVRVEVAGSLRRRKKTIGDLDLVASSLNPAKTAKTFAGLPQVKNKMAVGPTKVSVRLKSGLQADLRLVKPEQLGAAWLYFTGSKAHNIELRKIAQNRGWKLNEYGLFGSHNRVIAQETEKEIYEKLGFDCIPPEKREEVNWMQKYRRAKA